MFTNGDSALFGKWSAWESRGGVERVALIKSLIYMRERKNALKVQGCQVQLKMSADTKLKLIL